MEIVNHGIIERLQIPEDFTFVERGRIMHNCLQFNSFDGKSTIFYEQASNQFSKHDLAILDRIFNSAVSDRIDQPSPFHNQTGDSEQEAALNADLSEVLPRCFVFGGLLSAGGRMIDPDQTIWRIQRMNLNGKSRNVIIGNIHFASIGSLPVQNKSAVLVVPEMPTNGGSGYIWLEGNLDSVDARKSAFLTCICSGKYKQLSAIIPL